MVDTHPVSSGAEPLRWDPLVVLEDPYPTYRRLREQAPLYHDKERDFWAFTRYDDVQSAARDWATYSCMASRAARAVAGSASWPRSRVSILPNRSIRYG